MVLRFIGGTKGIKEKKAVPVLLVQKATKEIKATKGIKETKVIKGTKVTKGIKGSKGKRLNVGTVKKMESDIPVTFLVQNLGLITIAKTY
jgi:hypothetical protein